MRDYHMYTHLKNKNLTSFSNLDDLANFLSTPLEDLHELLSTPTDKYYSVFEIQKKSEKIRKIQSPNDYLKKIQRKLARYLENFCTIEDSACGFVRGKSIKDGARLHVGKKCILNIDFKDFFPEIKSKQVYDNLRMCYFPDEICKAITHIVCYNGGLPQGAPTSPILSNLVCRNLDKQLFQLSITYNFSYSRYADDLTFSTNDKIFHSSIVKKNGKKIILGTVLENIISENLFLINEKKIKLHLQNNRMETTGLTVNKKINLPREYLKNLRAILHNCEKNGLFHEARKYRRKNRLFVNISNKYIANPQKLTMQLSIWFYKKILGKIQYIRAILGEDNSYYLKFIKQLKKIAQAEFLDLLRKKKAKKLPFITSHNIY